MVGCNYQALRNKVGCLCVLDAMGWTNRTAPSSYVRRLTRHAMRLQDEARAALRRGDTAQAAQLIGDAELLAADVHQMVDAIAARDERALTVLAANWRTPAPPSSRWSLASPSRRARAALGTGIAMSLALVEC